MVPPRPPGSRDNEREGEGKTSACRNRRFICRSWHIWLISFSNQSGTEQINYYIQIVDGVAYSIRKHGPEVFVVIIVFSLSLSLGSKKLNEPGKTTCT